MNTPMENVDRSWLLSEIVDLERYPITDLQSGQGRELVARCRAEFVDAVSCELPGFIRPSAVEAVIADVEAREEHAFRSSRERSAYGFYAPSHDESPDIEEGDPHAAPQWRDVCYLAYDEFPPGGVLHTLYESAEVCAFTAALLGLPEIHPVADPLMAAPVSLYYEDCQLGWHCDTQEFTVTVMFRTSEAGGVFEYMPLAGPGDANFHRVPAVFEGERTEVRSVDIQPGSIVLFRGANTLHRVTRSRGRKPRLLSVFHLEQQPGRVYPEQWKVDVFGRHR
jgi:hypothetical protein